MLQRARDGVFSGFEVQRGLPIQMLVKHFDQIEQNWQIKPDLRRMIDFRPLNLLGDITALGKFWSMVTMLCGLCVLALPVAIISSGFAQEVGRRDFVVTWSLMSRIPLLAELDARAVAKVMPLLHAHNLPPNVEVIGEGEPCKAMYFVAAGQVLLTASQWLMVA